MYAPNATELDADWRKSTFSNPSGNCVMTAPLPGGVGIADSKDMAGPALLLDGPAFGEFLAGCKAGEFDDLA